MVHFYCQNIVGDADFSIDEWNKVYEEVKDLSEDEQNAILFPVLEPCKQQCFSCMAIVGERRLKTKALPITITP